VIQQLTVYDQHGAQVGMTFPKRARQLVSKQRALWHDDTHTSIRLLPEDKAEAAHDEDFAKDDTQKAFVTPGSNDLLLYLAKKNVREKRNLVRHVLAYIAVWPVIMMFYIGFLANTRHPFYHWLIEANRLLGEFSTFRTLSWHSYDAIWAVNNLAYSHTHPLWYVILGVMLAWGVWIAARVVKRVANSRRHARFKKARPDPVQLEYQRLKDMAADGVVTAKF